MNDVKIFNIFMKKKNSYTRIANRNMIYKKKGSIYYIFIVLFLIIIYFIFHYIPFCNNFIKNKGKINKKAIPNIIIKKNLVQELNDVDQYFSIILNNSLNNNNEIYYKSNNPKISIVIALFNAEGFIINTLHSIRNQDLKDIEIIMVDDDSKDNTTKLIKEYMKKDKRIILYENKENKGTLYTKARGIVNSKGKYIMIMDQDDLFTQKDVFSTLYEYIEINNLDILGFSVIYMYSNSTRKYVNMRSINSNNNEINNEINDFDFPIIYQPDIQKLFFIYDKDGMPKRINGVLWNNIYKTELFKKCIYQINEKFMNTKMNRHEDFLLFFLLTRNAYNFKYINRIFYAHIVWRNVNNSKIIFSQKQKSLNYTNIQCLSQLNYIEFLLVNTNNTIYDKRKAFFELNKGYLNHSCKFNQYNREKALNICKLFLENKFIEEKAKNIIKGFINEI